MAAGGALDNIFLNEVVVRIFFRILGSGIVRFLRIDLETFTVVFGHMPFVSTNSPHVFGPILPTGGG